MKYLGKEIDQLTDAELNQARASLLVIKANFDSKRDTDKFREKFKNRPHPEINPEFVNLTNAINSEIEKRDIKEV